MATKTASKVKASATSLMDSPAFKNVSAWALIYDGKQAGKVLWTIGNGGTWKCAIYSYMPELFGIEKDYNSEGTMWALSTRVIGTGGGGGYDKRSASFADCLYRNGITTPTDLSGRGTGAITNYLTGLGFTVVEVI